jgi:hypothetical protein
MKPARLASVLAIVVLSAFALGLVVATPEVYAGADAKVFPGAMCQKVGSLGVVEYTNAGAVKNTSIDDPELGTQGQFLLVTCPIVRDQTKKRWDLIQVRVFSPHTLQRVNCTARSSDRDGNSVDSEFQTAAFDDVNHQTLEFGPAEVDVDRGTFTLLCILPEARRKIIAIGEIVLYSEIASYYVLEK